MSNPWDRQRRAVTSLPDGAELPCPACGQPTDSLKQYRYISWVVFYLAGATWQTAHYRACPGCMRGLVGRRLAWNLLPANLLWPMLVLPWGLGLIVASYRKGHSPDVLRGVSPEAAAAREAAHLAAANEVSWGRVWVVVALLFCWVPLVGPVLALIAYLMNRHELGWKRRASLVALAVTGVVHLALAVLFLTGAVR
jgi:hypothetical protein